ncbi:hypothetical protein P8610_14090 [Fictibacillus sp. UD]|uniref:hypothetical protein n=1 Tax=Fictibacillus sp. UD TaxID=3038777 RepID=UPI003746BF88
MSERMNELGTKSNNSFSILNGMPSYVGLEQKEAVVLEIFSQLVAELLAVGENNKLSRVSVHLQKSSDNYEKHASYLEQHGFEMFTSSVEYYKELFEENEEEAHFSYFTLEDSILTEQKFKDLWKRVMQGSGNAVSTLSMDEQLQSVKHELGGE